MYYVFNSKLIEYEGKLIQAKVFNDSRHLLPNYALSVAEATPLGQPMMDMSFTVLDNAPLLDNLFTGAMIFVFSEKLISLIEEEQVPFQKFKTSIFKEKTKQEVSSFYIFHLLNLFAGIDVNASKTDGFSIESIALTENCLKIQPLLFRDAYKKRLIFIHEKLKAKFEAQNISGCSYIHFEEYKHKFGQVPYERIK